MGSADAPKLHELLQETSTFGGKALRVTTLSSTRHGEKCFRVDVPGESPYKIRIATPANPCAVDTEHAALALLYHNGLTWAPRIVEYHDGPRPYLVTNFFEGDTLQCDVVPPVRDAIDQLLVQMHAINGWHFGHLGMTLYPSWREFLDTRFWSHVNRCARERIITPEIVRLIERLYVDTESTCAEVQPVLLHGDMKPGNMIATSDGHCRLIDFEISRFGDVDFEWVKMHWLSLRWPAYRAAVAEPLLAGRLPGFDAAQWPAKHVLYSVYHVCAILSFERDVAIPTPGYRLEDLRGLIGLLRSRYG